MCSRDLVLRGSTALSVGDYDAAARLFTESLTTEQSYDILVQKSRALTELSNFSSALEDSGKAIALDAARPEAYVAQGIANFKSGAVQQAKDDFANAASRATESLQSVVATWVRKADAELNNKNFTNSGVKKIAKEDIIKPAAASVVPASEVRSTSGKIAYTWFQTVKTVGIEINHSLSSKDDLKTVFGLNKIEVSFPIGGGSHYDLSLDLFASINAETVKTNVTLHKIEIILEKLTPDQSWPTLNATTEAPAPVVAAEKPAATTSTQPKLPSSVAGTKLPTPLTPSQIAAQSAPAYPSSSLKKKNWDKIDQEIEEDMKKNKAEYGVSDDPMKGIFKQIYDASDEDTKRAMMKSFQTSGGTVLSTNWGEVKDKDYAGKDRPEAPKGQEWKKWEK